MFSHPRPKRRANANWYPRLATWLGLSLLVVEDITVTSVQDGHGGAAEELAASGAELNL